MKRVQTILAVISLLLVIIVVPSISNASARHPESAQASFEGSPAWAKLDVRLRDAWRQAAQGGGENKRLECLMKTERMLSADDRAMLQAAGFEARSVVGTIVTGGLKVRRVPDVAALPFVQAMELAVPLELKKKP